MATPLPAFVNRPTCMGLHSTTSTCTGEQHQPLNAQAKNSGVCVCMCVYVCMCVCACVHVHVCGVGGTSWKVPTHNWVPFSIEASKEIRQYQVL